MIYRRCLLFSLLVLTILPAPAAVAELDEHLAFLAPLVGPTWEGGYVGEGAPDLVIRRRLEPILAGQAVRYVREAPAVEFYAETRFYWSPDRREVRFVSLNSRGIVDEWADGSRESETVLHLDDRGTLTDTFTRLENGEWVRGHFQKFVAAP